MGHLGGLRGAVDEIYYRLRERIDAGHVRLPEPASPKASQALYELLELRFGEADARLAARMPFKPCTLEELEQRLGMERARLLPQLEEMAHKGLVLDLLHPTTGEPRYQLAPPVVGFFEFTLMRRQEPFDQGVAAQLLREYAEEDPHFVGALFGKDGEAPTVVGRAMVHEEALDEEALAQGNYPEILDYERVSSVLDEAKYFAVTNCYCRHEAEHLGRACDTPQELCLSMGEAAEYLVRRDFSRRIEREEAKAIVAQARELGLVQIADNVQYRPTYICNCCGCCCGQLKSISQFGAPHAVMTSNFLAAIDEERCKGCGRCARRCPIQAIGVQAQHKESTRQNKMVALVDESICLGCGVCVGACKKEALSLVPRRQRVLYPRDTVERVVRMALEQGNLHHVLLEAAQNTPARMLWRIVGAIIRLPPVKRRLAVHHTRSRFLQGVLAQVRKDPLMEGFYDPSDPDFQR